MKTPFKPLDLVENPKTGDVQMVDSMCWFNPHYYNVVSVYEFFDGTQGTHIKCLDGYKIISPKEVLINLDVKPKK